MRTTTQIIAKEGWKILSIVGVIFLLCWLLSWNVPGWISLITFVCLLYFYYNPERIPQEDSKDAIIAPLDAKVKKIETKEDGIYIELMKPICFRGLLRMPFSGYATKEQEVFGLLNAKENNGEYVKIKFCKNEEIDAHNLELKLYPTIYSYRISLCPKQLEKLGQRIGFFLSGKAVIKIPLNTELKVFENDRIYAGQTLMGYIRL
ncbi:hypothetical protein [Helicobacter burdigaliensis]|uniref:hypothetical protein n=1 Tax=Helicobacter burdigaliensis TaxID=2315334 RepID=UPI000EF65FF1|nr:hypothetical protein [Helicobacter burdigaliensis]